MRLILANNKLTDIPAAVGAINSKWYSLPAQLLCFQQNFLVICSLEFIWIQNEVSAEFDYDGKT